MYTTTQKILFRHCDPAGIGFFPRYFEIANDCVEGFFAEALGWPFETIHRSHAVPTAHIEADFKAPSRHGETLDLTLVVTRLGRSSLAYRLSATCAGAARFVVTATLVYVDETGSPTPWPAPIRDTIEHLLETSL